MAGARKRSSRCRNVYVWPPPPLPPQEFAATVTVLANWAKNQRFPLEKQRVLPGFLDRRYLVVHPIPFGAQGYTDLDNLCGAQLRYLFYRHSAKLLGWGPRREEGSDDGFPAELHIHLRTAVFP